MSRGVQSIDNSYLVFVVKLGELQLDLFVRRFVLCHFVDLNGLRQFNNFYALEN